MADSAPGGVNYSSWTAEDAVNAVVVPPTSVPSRTTVLNESWLQAPVNGTTRAQLPGSFDYIFGFKQNSSGVTTFVALTVNPSIRDGAFGSGGGAGNTGMWNAYMGALQDAVAFYSAQPNMPSARSGSHGGLSYPLAGRGGGSDPNTMDTAAQALSDFHDWLKGGNGAPGAAPTLDKWVKWLGDEQSGWQGTAADVVYQLITELGSVMDGWASQIDGQPQKDAKATSTTVSMPAALDASGYQLGFVGHTMNTVLDQWKTATTGDDGNAYYIPENGIRAALTARGLIGGWGYYDAALASTFPAERSGRFTYNDPSTDKAGDNLTIDQIWTYLNHAQAPNSGLQADAKWIWQLQLQKLDRSYSILLNSLAQTYRSAGSVLIPLRTATLHALDSNATPGAGTDTPALGGDPSLAGLGGGADVPGLGGDSSLAGLGGGADPSSLLADPGSLASLASIPDTSSLAVDPSSLPGLSPVPDVSNLAAVPGPTDPGASLAGFANPGTSGGLPQLSTGADWNNALSNLPGGSGAGLGYTGIPGLGTLGGLSSLDSLGKNGGAAGLAEAAGGPNGGAGAALAGESASPFGSAGGAAASGEGGIPLYPPTGGMGAGAGGADGAQERERHTWITEDEAVWGADPDLPPAVLGRN